MSVYQERLDRMMAAVHLENVDRIPFMASGSASNAALIGMDLATYCTDMREDLRANLEATRLYAPQADGVQGTLFNPYLLPVVWLSEVAVPGVDLPKNDLWQVHEKETITQEDYDAILEEGFLPWRQRVLAERLGDPMSHLGDYFALAGESVGVFAENGYPCFRGIDVFGPIEIFCGGRTLVNFFADDLFDCPEKVTEVFDKVQEANLAVWEQQLKDPATRPVGGWIGCWRGTPDLLKPEMFSSYAWKYTRELAELLISYDVTPLFHMDSNWLRGLEYFRDLPKGKVILGLDGKTDIFKAKEIIGDHCCLMGDVSATMLSFGGVEEVDAYCRRLIREVGPTGLILSSGCDAPYNAKLDNMRVMAESVFKYPI